MAERVPICLDCRLPFGWRLSDCRCEQNLLHRRIADLMDRIEKLRPLAYRCAAHEDEVAGCPCCDAVEVARLEGALQEIKRDQGKVCVNFGLCRHDGCRSSYTSWAIADASLAGRRVKSPAKVPTAWVQITEGFVPCNHVGMMERYATIAICGNCTAQWAPMSEPG